MGTPDVENPLTRRVLSLPSGIALVVWKSTAAGSRVSSRVARICPLSTEVGERPIGQAVGD